MPAGHELWSPTSVPNVIKVRWSGTLKGVVLSIIAALFAASYLLPFRQAIQQAPRISAITAMFLVAVVFNAGVALLQPRRRSLRCWQGRATWLTALLLAFFTLVGNFAIAKALPNIGAGMTSVVLKAQVVLTPILVWWVLKEAASSRLWLGATLAMLGVALPQLLSGEAHEARMGYAWALIAASAFAAMQVVTRRVIHTIESSVVNTLRLSISVAALLLLPDGQAILNLPWSVWGLAAAAGLFGPSLSRLYMMRALRHLSPSVTAVIALVGPVFAFLLEFVFLGEVPSALDILGACFILLGVIWVILPSLRVVSVFSPNASRPEAQSG